MILSINTSLNLFLKKLDGIISWTFMEIFLPVNLILSFLLMKAIWISRDSRKKGYVQLKYNYDDHLD